MGWDYCSYYACNFFIFLDLLEHRLEMHDFHLAVRLVLYLKTEGALNQSFQQVLVLNPYFLIFKVLDGAHLFLQLRNAVLEALLLPLQSVRNLLLHAGLSLYNLVPYLIEYLRYFRSVFIGRVFKFTEVVLDPVYLVLHLVFLLECSLE
jgi:hypothetical protein